MISSGVFARNLYPKRLMVMDVTAYFVKERKFGRQEEAGEPYYNRCFPLYEYQAWCTDDDDALV
jgi:hypothetical protein